jgi:hypothetical protein
VRRHRTGWQCLGACTTLLRMGWRVACVQSLHNLAHSHLLSGPRYALTWSQCSPIHDAHQGTHHHIQVGHLAVPPPHQVVRKIIAGLQCKGCHGLCPGIMGQPDLGLVVAEQCEAAHTGTGRNMRQCQCVIQLNGLQSDDLYQMICISTGQWYE